MQKNRPTGSVVRDFIVNELGKKITELDAELDEKRIQFSVFSSMSDEQFEVFWKKILSSLPAAKPAPKTPTKPKKFVITVQVRQAIVDHLGRLDPKAAIFQGRVKMLRKLFPGLTEQQIRVSLYHSKQRRKGKSGKK